MSTIDEAYDVWKAMPRALRRHWLVSLGLDVQLEGDDTPDPVLVGEIGWCKVCRQRPKKPPVGRDRDASWGVCEECLEQHLAEKRAMARLHRQVITEQGTAEEILGANMATFGSLTTRVVDHHDVAKLKDWRQRMQVIKDAIAFCSRIEQHLGGKPREFSNQQLVGQAADLRQRLEAQCGSQAPESPEETGGDTPPVEPEGCLNPDTPDPEDVDED